MWPYSFLCNQLFYKGNLLVVNVGFIVKIQSYAEKYSMLPKHPFTTSKANSVEMHF